MIHKTLLFLKMAPLESKVISTELPKDLDFGSSHYKKNVKKQVDDFYSDFRNLPKSLPRKKDLKEIKNELNDGYDFSTISKKKKTFKNISDSDIEDKLEVVDDQLRSGSIVNMNVKQVHNYENDIQTGEKEKMRSNLSCFFSIFSCLNIKWRKKTKEIDNLESTNSFDKKNQRQCSLKVVEDISVTGKKKNERKSKIVTLVLKRGPDRIRGLKGTQLPYLKQPQVNNQIWSGGGIISENHQKYSAVNNSPRIFPQEKNSEKINDDFNLIMEIVNKESGYVKLADQNCHREIEKILHNLTENVVKKTVESNYSKVLPIDEIEKNLRLASKSFVEKQTIDNLAKNLNLNIVPTEPVLNENSLICNSNTDNIYMDYSPPMYGNASNSSYDNYKPSPSSDELLSPVSWNTSGQNFAHQPPKIIVPTSANFNYLPESPSEKFMSIPTSYIGTYNDISPERSPIAKPLNTNNRNMGNVNILQNNINSHNNAQNTSLQNASQIQQCEENQIDLYMQMNSNYSDSIINVHSHENTNFDIGNQQTVQDLDKITNLPHSNITFSMGEFNEINIFTQESALNTSPYSGYEQFSPQGQYSNHYSQMTPPYSENTSPKNSLTNINSTIQVLTENTIFFNVQMNSEKPNLNSLCVSNSTVLSPVSSSGHKSPQCSNNIQTSNSNKSSLSESSESERIMETGNFETWGKSMQGKSTKDVFRETYEKLGLYMRKRICLKIHSMVENDLLDFLHAILNNISQCNTEDIMNMSLFHLMCERLLMSKPIVFIEAGSKLLHESAIACYRLPILTKYLSECIIKAHRLLVDRGLAAEKKQIIFDDYDIYGNNLLHRLVIHGDAYSQSLAAILPNKDMEHFKNAVLFDVKKLNSDGYSPLHLACKKHGTPFTLEDFVQGENIGSGKIGEIRSSLYMAKLLLYEGNADIMFKDGKSGNTCLHLAVDATLCDSQLVTTILDAANDQQRRSLVACPNYSHSTPLDLARAALKSPNRPNYPKSVLDKMKKCK